MLHPRQVVVVSVLAACATTPMSPSIDATNDVAHDDRELTADPAQMSLGVAVTQYHDRRDLSLLREWLLCHPDHEEADIWREIVALRDYERASLGSWIEASASIESDVAAPGPDIAADGPDDGALADAALPDRDLVTLRALADQASDTLAGQTARAVLESERAQLLFEPPVSERIVRFLDGDPDWAGDESDVDAATLRYVELPVFRKKYAPVVKARLASALVADGCWTLMGLCTWWLSRFPQDEVSAKVASAQRDVWYRRGHPAWRGRNHAYCANVCVRTCRSQAEPLDDGCFTPCYAKCPNADGDAVSRPRDSLVR